VKYFSFRADVAGGFGPHSVVRHVPGALLVDKLHYIFEGWRGDEIVESCPCCIVTERLAGMIKAAGLTGVSFDSVEIGRSDIFLELQPGQELPPFLWMKVSGTKGQDDFFYARYARLVISQRAWEVIQPYAPNAIVDEFKDGPQHV
jgi:hypothetical protein